MNVAYLGAQEHGALYSYYPAGFGPQPYDF